MLIVPRNEDANKDYNTKSRQHNQHNQQDATLIKAIAKAYKWKMMLEERKVTSLAEIAERENLNISYGSKMFNLNFLSPA